MSERKPPYTTDRPRKYLAGRRYMAGDFLPIFGGGKFWPETRFSATGQFGSMLYKPCRGKRRPTDLLIEVCKLRKCRQPEIYDTYWIAARLFDNPYLIKCVRKLRKKEEVKRSIDRAISRIERSRPLQPSSR